ncbi:MAG: hypothetical protein DRG82_03170 [Deltaproteobacteria bacterium]|nr:MAG: hypothetical protein B1H13_06695 [Desulfobacteraceae bacterium 4484_190.3]RLB18749.1 MAG: hypothetical protein DRG82_03170 [Deltaproteobacteria bacterium]
MKDNNALSSPPPGQQIHLYGKMEPLIVLDRITRRVRDQFALKDTSWEIREREHWAIIGRNGSGKTTLELEKFSLKAGSL